MSEIRAELDAIRGENRALASAADEFKTYDKSYIENMVSCLESMHSDYINLLKTSLKNLADTSAPELVKRAKAYSNAIKTTADSFEEGDAAISGEIRKGK